MAALVLNLLLLGSVALALVSPEWLIAPSAGRAAARSTTLVSITVIVAVFASYSVWRYRVELLARRPGPIMVLPFMDNTWRGANDPLARELKSTFEDRLVKTRLYGATAVPSTASSSDFLRVVEAAGEQLRGAWGAASRFVRLFAPVTAFQVSCTLQSAEGPEPCVLIIELSRLPRTSLAPFPVTGSTWEEAAERAAHAVAGHVLPRTDQCRQAPWPLWQGFRIPLGLFHDYQRFLKLRSERYYDESVGALRLALRRDPGNLMMRLELGKMQERQQMYLDALLTYDDIITVAAHQDPHLGAWWSPTGVDNRPTWSNPRASRGLRADDPTILVARYRHAMLLGLGEKIASQWWGRRERCATREHRSAREERRAHLRKALRHRFLRRYRRFLQGGGGPSWLADLELGLNPVERRDRTAHARTFFTMISQLEFERLADDYVKVRPREALRAAMGREDEVPHVRAFLTWRNPNLAHDPSLPLDLRLPRRSGRLATRASEEILPREAILTGLPWSALRRAMAHEHISRRGLSQYRYHGLGVPPGRSIVARGTGRDVEPFPDATRVLDGDWPVPPARLEDVVARLTGRPDSAPRTWRAHFNAACVLALPLLAPDGRAWPRKTRGAVVARAARGSVAELERAAACADSDFIARQRDWLLAEEPDLDQLRGRGEFKDFEATTFGSIGAAVQRGPDIHLWRQSTYVARFISAAAKEMALLWERRLSGRVDRGEDRRLWLDEEMTAWRLAERLATDPRDSGTRQDVARQITITGRLESLRKPRVPHPRFSNLVLDRQLTSMAGGGDTALLSVHRKVRGESVAFRISRAIVKSDRRLRNLAGSLRERAPEQAADCCSMGRRPVLRDEEEELRRLFRGGAEMDAATEKAWSRASKARWEALAEWFDDETFDGRTTAQRWAAFHLAMRRNWWADVERSSQPRDAAPGRRAGR
ncbi:hypothetical protein [Actinomycetospora callitridis]|uniref:hypothetical protein n=1 Tax=Actinomycetospora callitridis TaxID=913944 RepID=UPI00236596BD|nr:hypothetical protein [Actinomycetospora callitridis]